MVVYKFRNRKQCLCCLPGHTNRGHCNVGNQDQRMSSGLWEQNSPWWETVTWSCVYVNTSPSHPKSDDWSVFFPPSTTLWSNDIVIFIVEACLSLITYQAEVLIWSAADQLIRFHLPGKAWPQPATDLPNVTYRRVLVAAPVGVRRPEKHTWFHPSPWQQSQIMTIHQQEEGDPVTAGVFEGNAWITTRL